MNCPWLIIQSVLQQLSIIVVALAIIVITIVIVIVIVIVITMIVILIIAATLKPLILMTLLVAVNPLRAR